MMSSKIEDGYKSSKQLRLEVVQISKELDDLINEHDSYAIENVDDLVKVGNYIEAYPIETLRESLEFDKPKEQRKKELKKFSLPYLKEKMRLQREFEKKEVELSLKKDQLRTVLIDELIEKVKQIENTTP